MSLASAIEFKNSGPELSIVWWIFVVLLILVYCLLQLKKRKVGGLASMFKHKANNPHSITRVAYGHPLSLYKVIVDNKVFYFIQDHHSLVQLNSELAFNEINEMNSKISDEDAQGER